MYNQITLLCTWNIVSQLQQNIYIKKKILNKYTGGNQQQNNWGRGTDKWAGI